MSAEYSTSLADERTHGSQSSSPPASQAVPRPTYSPGDDRARFPALGERISEADWHPGMPADDRFVVGRSSERIRETISQASVPEEPNGSDSVDEEALQRTQEDSNSRLASLSLWDDNEPFTSTPAPAPPSDATAHGSQTNIPKQPPETYHSYSQDRVLSPDPYAYLPSLHRAIMLQMHENDADNDFDDDYIGIDERRIIRVVKFKDPGITTQEIQYV
ncbi:hypothetical protein OE88DRAFT_959483 [Heliocybe sulcata]|uniref:Uncharacterized protein n=1 Tax=Heliocybe sulcata TaxID=5364 RepID=A0A5C3NAE7_9AGAM|nr:hypothetical protein OE88DRAFT_959483 [Heliocybe sulcata]